MNELESLLNGTELKFPNLPASSQGVERAVKLTTENSQIVYGQEARHKHITKSFWPPKTSIFIEKKIHRTIQFHCYIYYIIYSKNKLLDPKVTAEKFNLGIFVLEVYF